MPHGTGISAFWPALAGLDGTPCCGRQNRLDAGLPATLRNRFDTWRADGYFVPEF